MTQKEMAKQKYEGQTFDLRNGYTATVIEYVNSTHVIVQFNDGKTCVTKASNVSKGSIRHPDWTASEWQKGYRNDKLIGKQFPIKNDTYVTIKEMYNDNNVIIEWNDGTISKTRLFNIKTKNIKHPNWSYAEWNCINGEDYRTILHRKEQIGKKYSLKHGYTVTIIDYRGSEDITIEWNDGTISKTKIYSLTTGNIKHPDWAKGEWKTGIRYSAIVNKTYQAKHGYSFTITSVTTLKCINITWSDGKTSITTWYSIQQNSTKHPDWTNSEWRTGRKHEDIMSKTYFDTIGLPLHVVDIQTTKKSIKIQDATGCIRPIPNWTQFNIGHKLPPSLYIKNDGKMILRGTLWDITILGIAYILNNTYYLTYEDADKNRYIISVPDLYETKTGKPYPYDLWEKEVQKQCTK